MGDSIPLLCASDLRSALSTSTYWQTTVAHGGYTTAQVNALELPQITGNGYDHWILWAGINDIYASVPEATIETNLGTVYTAAAINSATVYALTIIPYPANPLLSPTIKNVNTWIAAQASGTVTVVDTWTAFGGDTPNMSLYEADNVHPNADGIDVAVALMVAAIDEESR
jgi:lysophospholipase L1-like esterase